ncbi:uncharacterized protein PITG_11402 [Phytophthora infestans T30-4]|uniref:HTH CENPB-type domain-containing protein n=1 Tax=Phytophthora infestans (strain T30-4) TaxID=403677 RepID=D0NIP7_PHYIT|nr:uncharacterized protein PITG_11402 [Phytophthora infestans T30-4]EEY59381.1 conserved hypothetical protein [Phytophthora infestans T30-4]|eukprot:XP_002900991.1 conserved hypothetical protein [Phytophthora infestans T30-4]
MVRPRINGPGKKRKTYQRRAVEYAHKRDVLDFIDSGHSLDETISQFYGDLSGSDIRAKKKQIHKWSKQAPTIRAACDSGRGCHRNLRGLGEATVLTKEAERAIVVWVNSLRKDGAPVSRLMLQLQAKEAAADIGLEGKFAATSTWVKLFLRRHKLALRVRTRQGQTTPQDAQDAATTFRALVLQTIVEKKCVQVYNADQTAGIGPLKLKNMQRLLTLSYLKYRRVTQSEAGTGSDSVGSYEEQSLAHTDRGVSELISHLSFQQHTTTMKFIFQALAAMAFMAGGAAELQNGVQLGETFGGPHGDKYSDETTLYHGGDGGDKNTLTLGQNEHITGIEAHWGKYYRHTRIMYIKFTTDAGHTIYGGTPSDQIGKDDAPDGYQLGGLAGFCGNEIDSVGAVWTSIKPTP